MQTKEIDYKKSEVEVLGFWWDFCPAFILIIIKKGKKEHINMNPFPPIWKLPQLAFHMGLVSFTMTTANSTWF